LYVAFDGGPGAPEDAEEEPDEEDDDPAEPSYIWMTDRRMA
jgi:hypothetical protein